MLRIGADFELPLETVTRTITVVGMRGMGKTHEGKVEAEEMLDAHQQVGVLDPNGVWYGLRSGKNGSAKGGYEILIVGGHYADLQMEGGEGGAHVIAELVFNKRWSFILDLSMLSKTKGNAWVTAFLEHLFFLKQSAKERTPLHLIIDEADRFAPQQGDNTTRQMLGAVDDVFRRGRAFGFGGTILTQRPAKLNKDVMTQCDAIIAMGMTGYTDRVATLDWFKAFATKEQLALLDADLPRLQQGEAWFWAPGWLGEMKKVKIRALRTFDSSFTPEVGNASSGPTSMSKIDLDEAREEMLKIAGKGTRPNTKTGGRQAKKPQAAPAAATAEPEVRVEVKTEYINVDVPILRDGEAQLLREAATKLRETGQELIDRADQIIGKLAAVENSPPPAPPKAALPPNEKRDRPARQPSATGVTVSGSARREKDNSAADQRILNVLARFDQVDIGLDPLQLAMFSKQSHKSSAYEKHLRTLKSEGLIQFENGTYWITELGREAADPGDPPSTNDEYHEEIKKWLEPKAAALLDVVIENGDDWVSYADAAELSNQSLTSSAFEKHIRTLRAWGLVEVESRRIKATDKLFPISEEQA